MPTIVGSRAGRAGEDERAGRLAYEQLTALPLQWVEASEPLLERTAGIRHTIPCRSQRPGLLPPPNRSAPRCCTKTLNSGLLPSSLRNGSAEPPGPVAVPLPVLCELVWVLR